VKNHLGVAITGPEEELVAIYHSMHRLVSERRRELAPYQERNALKALSCLWQIVNGLDMEPEQLYHIGI
jgi:hypothetical protein